VPLTAPIVMSETFNSGFALNVRYNFNVSDTSVPWHLVNASGIVNQSYTWGRVTGLPIADSLWNAATNPPGTLPISAGQPYTKNMQAYAIYGPLDTTNFSSVLISATYAMDTLAGDMFGMAYSTNGTDFIWMAQFGRNPSLAIKRTDYYPLPAEARWQRQDCAVLPARTAQHRRAGRLCRRCLPALCRPPRSICHGRLDFADANPNAASVLLYTTLRLGHTRSSCGGRYGMVLRH
jgi:hypothetical protein